MRILQNIHNYDVLTFDWCLRRKHRELAVKISRFVSFSADGPLYGVVGVLFLLQGNWALGKLIALAFALERSCYLIFKSTFRRNRPPQAIPGYQSEVIPSDQFSFPSGHTSAAFLMAGVLSYAFPWLAFILYPWACCVGIARVMLGVHFPTDILAGAVLGSSICCLLTTLLL